MCIRFSGVIALALGLCGCGQQRTESTAAPDIAPTGQAERDAPAEEPTPTVAPAIRETQFTVKEAWRIEELGAPADLAYDEVTGDLRLSQIGGEGNVKDGNGVVSRVSLQGEIHEFAWARGFDAPKGLICDEDSLWVLDIDQVWELDRKEGTVRNKSRAPAGSFLVGGAMTADRRLLLADLLGSRIMSLSDGRMRILSAGESLESPTRVGTSNAGLIVATWGYSRDFSGNQLGRILRCNLQGGEPHALEIPMRGHWMGLCPDGDAGWYIGDFETGTILKVSESGDAERIATLGRGLSSILYLPEQKLLIAVHVTENRVVAWRLSLAIADGGRIMPQLR